MTRGIFYLILAGAFGFSACNQVQTGGGDTVITKGSTVSMHYKLTVDGQVVDSSEGRDPLSFVLGQGQIIPGLDEQLGGLKAGDKRHYTISPDKGYGQPSPEAFQKVPKEAFQDTSQLKVGNAVSGDAGGRPFKAVVAEITEKEVTLDLNHPLAGKTLEFDIEVVSVKAGSAK